MNIIINALNTCSPLASRLLSPLLALFDAGLRSKKAAPKSGQELSDSAFTVFGTLRAMLGFNSGRHALQDLPAELDWTEGFLPRATWFHALANSKRLDCLTATQELLRQSLESKMPDSLACYPELNSLDVFIGDGHWHGAALHDSRELATESNAPLALPVGHIYFTNHRSGLMRHHVKCASGTQEHDMSALSRAPLRFLLEQRKSSGRKKTLIIYDRAAINHPYWNKAKQSSGFYLLTRYKANLQPRHVKWRDLDTSNPINARVISDELVLCAGKPWRKIEVEKAGAEDETVCILTNELTLEPGLLAHLYRQRWDIERAFDCFKHKMEETQAWASGEIAKTAQALFICLAYNLVRWLEWDLAQKDGVSNVAEEARREERTEERMATEKAKVRAAKKHKGPLACMNRTMPARVIVESRQTTLSVKLLRWIATFIGRTKPWSEMLEHLRRAFAEI